MSYGHALAMLRRCADDPTCTRPGIVRDDDDPTVVRCAVHALARC